MLANWSTGGSIFDSKELMNHLKTSIDALDGPILKQLFLDLGSFPEDQEIPATLLMDMCVELYNLDEMGKCTMDSLHKLSSRNLVNHVSRRYFYRQICYQCGQLTFAIRDSLTLLYAHFVFRCFNKGVDSQHVNGSLLYYMYAYSYCISLSYLSLYSQER